MKSGLLAAAMHGLKAATALPDTIQKQAYEKFGLKPLSPEAAARLAASVPGPPRETQWNSSSAPLPQMRLVNTGMRPITGGRRRTF